VKAPSSSILGATVSATVALLLLSQAGLQFPSGIRDVSVSDAFGSGPGGAVNVTSHVDAPFAADLRVVDFLRTVAPTNSTLYYYYDASYPTSFSDLPDWFGLTQHLAQVAAARDFPLSLHLLNASQLALFLASPPYARATLVIASGVLPDTVYAPGFDLLRPWIDGGGTLIWAGDRIGIYYAHPLGHGHFPPTPILGNNGTAQFLNPHWFGGIGQIGDPRIPSQSIYTHDSLYETAFDLNYPYAIFGDGLRIANLTADGGTDLGLTSGEFTNFARVPVGNGSIVYFGAPLSDVVRLSYVLIDLLQVGLVDHPVALLGIQNISLAAGTAVTLQSSYPLGPSPTSTTMFCRVVLQVDYLATLFDQHCAHP
jgi:hypothetical protein